MNSLEIKHALMSYFRFKRQWICASECLNNDVMVITDKDIIDVEVKINKYDLWKDEVKKDKHRLYKKDTLLGVWKTGYANRFYICVPYQLLEEARKWVNETNKKYGIIQYNPDVHFSFSIAIKKTAQTLFTGKRERLTKSIMMRICSENIGLIEGLLRKRKNE